MNIYEQWLNLEIALETSSEEIERCDNIMIDTADPDHYHFVEDVKDNLLNLQRKMMITNVGLQCEVIDALRVTRFKFLHFEGEAYVIRLSDNNVLTYEKRY